MVVQANFRKRWIYKSLLSFANLDRTDFAPLLKSCCAIVASPMQVSGTTSIKEENMRISSIVAGTFLAVLLAAGSFETKLNAQDPSGEVFTVPFAFWPMGTRSNPELMRSDGLRTLF